MSFTYTYSREQLQGLQAEYRKEQLFSYVDQYISNYVTAEARQGKKEFFWIPPNKNTRLLTNPPQLTFTNEEIIEAVKEKFPGTHVEYQETWLETRPGVKEQRKGILIDWS